MRVIQAQAMGMCFGVRDALAAARDLPLPTQVTVFGQLVHNPLVSNELQLRGFRLMDETTRDTASIESPTVLITAHGVSNRERAALLAAGKRIIDTTCPLVKKAHATALSLHGQGYFIVVAGKAGHVEVRGLTGDLSQFAVIESVADVHRWDVQKIAVIAQTTSVDCEVRALVARVRELHPHAEVRFENTICQPTRDRQAALEQVIQEVDVLVVVGGLQSNNARQLVARAENAGIRTLQVEGERDLQPEMFDGWEVVGLTAGTSTLPGTIDAVRRRLEAMSANIPRHWTLNS